MKWLFKPLNQREWQPQKARAGIEDETYKFKTFIWENTGDGGMSFFLSPFKCLLTNVFWDREAD